MGTVIRPARLGDGAAVFEITKRSVEGLARGSYPDDVIDDWMGARSPEFYEKLITRSRMFVAERSDGTVVALVDTVPGEVTRLFILPEAAGKGLGKRLLALGIEKASENFDGPVRVEATLNAVDFYKKHGFVTVHRALSSHDVGGAVFEIVHMERR